MLFPTIDLAVLTPLSWTLEFIAICCGIVALSFVFRVISGWSSLERLYRAPGPFAGKRLWFCSGSMNSVSYGRNLVLGADETGLYLALMFPFNFAAPPLLIPWEDVTATPTRFLLFRFLEFRFRQAPSVVFKVSEELGRKLLRSSPIAPDGA